MKRFSISVSEECYRFIADSAKNKDVSMSDFCADIIDKHRDELRSFEKNILFELNSNSTIMEKILNKLSELDKISNAHLLLQRLVSKESSKAGFLAKTRFEEFEDQDERRRLLKKMDDYVDEIDGNFVKVLKKMDVI